MRSCCDENNEVLGIRIGAKRDFFNIKLKHKTLKVRINISAAFQQKYSRSCYRLTLIPFTLYILGVFPFYRLSLVEYPQYSGFVQPLLQVNHMSSLALASAICWFLRRSPNSESVEVHPWVG
jgi:hypothetical protein